MNCGIYNYPARFGIYNYPVDLLSESENVYVLGNNLLLTPFK